MKLDTVLYQLQHHTMAFLQSHVLTLHGAALSGPRINYLCYHDGAQGANEGFQIAPDPLITPLQGIDHMVYKAIKVHSVRMIKSSEDFDVSDLEPYVLDGTGADLMVTGQLSGCVFAIRQEPGRLIVAHVQPGGNRQPGAMLRQTIKLMGRFANYGRVTHVFGRGDYHGRAHVLGVRKGGTWQIFAQEVASGSGPVVRAMRII
jgi:hypothetical protein